MLLAIFLLSLVLPNLTNAGPADAKHGNQDLENLVNKLEFRLREMEMKLTNEKKELVARNEDVERRLEAKDKEMETRLEAKIKEMEGRLMEKLEDKVKKEKEKLEWGMETSTSELRKEVEESAESLRNEFASSFANQPSLRDLPIVIISAWRGSHITSPQTVTFDSFLANFNNADRPGGGCGELDLDSGIFTCFTPGYYTVSFSAYGTLGPDHVAQALFLFKNGEQFSESGLDIWHNGQWTMDANVGVTSTRILILHMDAGDMLELRMTLGDYVHSITFNIELTGLGFDYLV